MITTTIDSLMFDSLHRDKKIQINIDIDINTYLFVESEDSQNVIPCFYDASHTLHKVNITDKSFGLRPRNAEQHCAIHAIRNPDIPCITLMGYAGTGKTIVAIASALDLVADQRLYEKIVIVKPVVPVGRDLGFLPGDKSDKLAVWAGPFYDNVTQLVEENAGEIFQRWIEIDAVTYMRGRSIANAIVILDEAQNLSRHEIKTMVTRIGHKSKIILCGDPEQADIKNVDGLEYFLDRSANHPLFTSVYLTKSVRSPLSEAAANIL